MIPALSELAEFVLARVAEDEEIARAVARPPWQVAGDGFRVVDGGGVEAASAFALDGSQQRATAQHIARHDPARVLADCAVKRLLIDECLSTSGIDQAVDSPLGMIHWGLLRAMAKPYAWHPHYRVAWAAR